MTVTEKRIIDIFDRLGPIPRLSLEFSFDPPILAQYEEQINSAILKIPLQLDKLFNATRGLDMDALSHMLCLISR